MPTLISRFAERVTFTVKRIADDWDEAAAPVFHDEIRLDRRLTRRQIKRYTRRAGIETSYSDIKEFAPWTTSREYAVRLFHFGFAMLLYDMWLLVDLLVQRSLDMLNSARNRG